MVNKNESFIRNTNPAFYKPVVALHHIGEYLVARLLQKALTDSRVISCYVRKGTNTQNWKRDTLFNSLGKHQISRIVCDSRLHHNSEKLNALYRLDCGIIKSNGRCFPVEVKLGVSWNNLGFREKFILKKPVKKHLRSDTWGGSVPALLEGYFESENLDCSKLFVWTEQQKTALDNQWCLVVRESQIDSLKSESFRKLTHLISLESIIAGVGESFEQIADSLVWKPGEAFNTLMGY